MQKKLNFPKDEKAEKLKGYWLKELKMWQKAESCRVKGLEEFKKKKKG